MRIEDSGRLRLDRRLLRPQARSAVARARHRRLRRHLVFQVEFGRSVSSAERRREAAEATSLDWTTLHSVWLTRWEEHCVECSAPQCFSTCSLYAKRADLMCARFAGGIRRNPA